MRIADTYLLQNQLPGDTPGQDADLQKRPTRPKY